jgi:hypothetical protein
MIVQKTKGMLADAGLSKKLWVGVANITTYLKNRSPKKAVSSIPEKA